MLKIIDGEKNSKKIKDALREEVLLMKKNGIIPNLAVILVGDDNASQIYVRNKERVAKEIGINSQTFHFPASISQEKLESLILKLNSDQNIHGILIQLPLPDTIIVKKILTLIDPKKDVDCFHPENIGKLMIGDAYFLPCTPAGVLELLKKSEIPIEGKRIVIIGRSNIVGKPLAIILINLGATVTVCNSKTKDLQEISSQADILISATGCAKIINATMIKQNAVVIDIGINRNAKGKLVGDVDYANVYNKVSHITPVPGGVGPMTIAMLMQNVIKAVKLHNK
jgi:methylenetetrahydrofolate dehydrogenase (NADP+)/methenyltetrahydrofolate cyclohydrolase